MFDIVRAMQVTREGDYGIRSVLYLARQPFKKISFVTEISDDYKIPRSFLAKILQKLVKAKIVRSYRGVKGGFSLAKQARDISMLDVLEAIEGKLYLNVCLMDKKKCGFSRHCPVNDVWTTAQGKVVEVLKKTNFDDLARQKG
jgi:Rrf2 family transcriptional regulator, iron-sulfur cluster assembly transcription factor